MSPATHFDLQAHRGGAGLWPENTLEAFGRALALGVSTLELDVEDGHGKSVEDGHGKSVEDGHGASVEGHASGP